MSKTLIYQIRCLTNLHAGSGDADYGIVDKLVQRDPTTNYPTIHSSSLKGALREFFKKKSNTNLTDIFGSDPKANSGNMQAGKVNFLSADIIALPKIDNGPGIGDNQSSYTLAYVEADLTTWIEKAKLFDADLRVRIVDTNFTSVSTSDFKEIASELPVIARNYLDNGESKNLWYEELVPRESVFGCIIHGEDTAIDAFKTAVDNQIVQIGGNATVGYGYCLFTPISSPQKTTV